MSRMRANPAARLATSSIRTSMCPMRDIVTNESSRIACRSQRMSPEVVPFPRTSRDSTGMGLRRRAGSDAGRGGTRRAR
jgi:hypothetical protein